MDGLSEFKAKIFEVTGKRKIDYKELSRKAAETGDYSYLLDDLPYDSKYPNVDQSRNCFDNYANYHRCRNKYGESFKPCNGFKVLYKMNCFDFQIEEWNSDITKFPADLS